VKGLGLLVVLALVLVMFAGATWVMRARRGSLALALPHALAPTVGPGGPSAPAGVRIRVEVLNASRVRGLARRATLLLRDRGFDVVETGTVQPTRDSTLVLDRSGHPSWAAVVAEVMGPAARSEARPDSSRYLDITVLVGASWRPPAEPLYP
jgi:hypothetical protein